MKKYSIWAVVACVLCVYSMQAKGEDMREVYEAEINADIDDVWKAFSTSEGLQAWMAPVVEIDMTVGGKMKSNYNPDGKIGDPESIENTILSYDPKRMLSLKATKFPEGFPFAEAAENAWSVFYFSEISPEITKITIVGLGYTQSEESKAMREMFSDSNRHMIEQLKRALEKK